jgi:hypothetical protein
VFTPAPARASAPSAAYLVDFEFRQDAGERPLVWCLTVHEESTGREWKYWRDELLTMKRAPFPTGPEVAVVGFFASAEWGCFLQLGWAMPKLPVDLFAEVKVAFNRHVPKALRTAAAGDRWSLLAALDRYGIAVDAGAEARKSAMRKLASTMTVASWTPELQAELLDYCLDDTRKLAELWRAMKFALDWPQAQLRGLYTLVCAAIEHAGIPVDGKLFRRLAANWDRIKGHYIAELEQHYGFAFHPDGHFSQSRFLEWTAAQGIDWPLAPHGAPKLNDRTLRAMARQFPQLQKFRETYSHILDCKVSALPVGADDRNRFLQSPFNTATGRTVPKVAKNLWAQPGWVRPLLRPPAEYGVAILDWKSQEYCIAASASGDERMIAACRSPDPYWRFAEDAHLVLAGEQVREPLRGRCKRVALGVTYGMTEIGAAAQLDIPVFDARELIQRHKSTYSRCWRWLEETGNRALVNEIMATPFGWKWRPVTYCTDRIVDHPSIRSIQNFHCQATGADMLRAAAVLLWLAGIEIVHTMHDAIMILAPLERLAEAVAIAEACMIKAGLAITGFALNVDKACARAPRRYLAGKLPATWCRTLDLLQRLPKAA